MRKKILRSVGMAMLASALVGAFGLGVAATEPFSLTVTPYADVLRFVLADQTVKELRLEVFSLAGHRMFDSGYRAGQALDWKMRNDRGLPVANGVYLYFLGVKDSAGNAMKRSGKLVILRGRVGLVQSPPLTVPGLAEVERFLLQPQAHLAQNFASLHITTNIDVAASGGGSLVIGDDTGTHLAMDNNELQSYGSDGQAASGGLLLQNDGGGVSVGATGGVSWRVVCPNRCRSGHADNSITSAVVGGTIAGGGATNPDHNLVTDDYGTVSGGDNNQAGDNAGTTSDKSYATVGGGHSNTASGSFSTVGGGFGNTASVINATVGGGQGNDASASNATVGGGLSNEASGAESTVPGGWDNAAVGNRSLAAGRRAKAMHDGTFVWGDNTDADFASTAVNQFLIRASGGVGIGTNAPAAGAALTVQGNVSINSLLDLGTDACSVLSAAGRGRICFDGTTFRVSENGGAYQDLTVGGAAGWGLTGNASTNPATDYLGTSDAQPLLFRTNSTERVRIDTGGNVGIGTTSPSNKIQVQDTATPAAFTRTAAGDGGNRNAFLLERDNAPSPTANDSVAFTFRLKRADGSFINVAGARGVLESAAGGGAGAFAFSTKGVGDTFEVERMRVTSTGNLGLGVTNPTQPIQHSNGAFLSAGGAWTDASDRNLKGNFAPIDGRVLLEKLARLPIQSWNYKGEGSSIKHLGPVAQDFYALFGLGQDDKHLSALDVNGVALASIQALYELVKEKDQRITDLTGEVQDLRQRVQELEQAVKELRATAKQ